MPSQIPAPLASSSLLYLASCFRPFSFCPPHFCFVSLHQCPDGARVSQAASQPGTIKDWGDTLTGQHTEIKGSHISTVKWATDGNPNSTLSNTSITEKDYTPSQICRQMFTTLDTDAPNYTPWKQTCMHIVAYVLFIFKGPGSKTSPPTWTAGKKFRL